MQESERIPPTSSPSGDYGYDMAHELDSGGAPAPAADVVRRPPDQVATQSSDLDQDYGYDLAHDIPRFVGDQPPGGS